MRSLSSGQRGPESDMPDLRPDTLSPMREFDPQLAGQDPGWAHLFHIPPHPAGDGKSAYFAGNSLGLQPLATKGAIDDELQRWAQWGVEGQLQGPRPWKDYHEALREPAALLVGALPEETVIMNSLTVNLHLLMASFYRPSGQRSKILMEDIVFPSDGYAIDAQVRWHNLDPVEHVIRLRPRVGEDTLRTADILAAIDEHKDDLAVVLFSAVNYLTGEFMDMPVITAAGQRAGACVGWDLAHAAGNVELLLHDWNVDFAAWCSYKYLNSGPGAVAGAFIHARHVVDTAMPRLAGWWGSRADTRFMMERHFDPPPTADAWQVSNPPIFAMAPVEISLKIFADITMPVIAQRSKRLNHYLRELFQEVANEVPAGSLHVITPPEPQRHGCQVSVRFSGDIRTITDQLRDQFGVIADGRNPDIIRFAPVGLYSTYFDCWRAATALTRVLA